LVFKKIFGVEENKDLLISLINSIVSEQDRVAEVTLLNPYNPQNFGNDKLSILDIKAKSVEGKRFNIEIQVTDEANYDKRALYYWAKLYSEQLRVRDGYSKLQKAIGIHILNFDSVPGTPKYHNAFHITEKETGLAYFKDLELHTIELTKFGKDLSDELSDLVSKIKNALDIWLAFLTRNELLNAEDLPKELNDPCLKKAIQVLNVINFSEEERNAYEDRLKWLMIEEDTISKYIQEGLLIGIEKGMEKGREEGMEKGIEKGIEKGREEGEYKKAVQIAKKMLFKNHSLQDIADLTGLSISEIESLHS
jgi:predicted transposase/invertase (TIGR01784 family)